MPLEECSGESNMYNWKRKHIEVIVMLNHKLKNNNRHNVPI